jgi:transcriptional regulator with XRE-family HTH domain
MTNAGYSKAVLTGMTQRGLTLNDVAHIAGVPLSTVRLVMKEKAALKDRHLERIEHTTGITAGQFAASTFGEDARPLKELMNLLAEARKSPNLNSGASAAKRSRRVRVGR